ncbi:hypothetical protein BSKO_07300 [Bryopsis sp. KO-2023]|nr:hypothetical protein BSKO_07300 [Bryopsis sp. KO-2023]
MGGRGVHVLQTTSVLHSPGAVGTRPSNFRHISRSWTPHSPSVRRTSISAGASAQPLEAELSGMPAQWDTSTSFSLDNVRSSLIRQEDTTLFNLIERAQFARNSAVYTAEAIPVPGFSADGSRLSLLEYVLRGTEQLHGKIRRFTSCDEHAFYPNELPPLVLPPIKYPDVLPPSAHKVNVNDKIMNLYKNVILPGITVDGDDGNYGSASMYDVFCLQALSRRIHFGKFVAEAKFRADPELYTALIKKEDADGIMKLLTNRAVEEKVIERVRLKAVTYGQDPEAAANGECTYKVEPSVVADLFDQWIMPLTKEVQVECLLRRFEDSNGDP